MPLVVFGRWQAGYALEMNSLLVGRGRLGKLSNEDGKAFDILCRRVHGCFNSAPKSNHRERERDRNYEKKIVTLEVGWGRLERGRGWEDVRGNRRRIRRGRGLS